MENKRIVIFSGTTEGRVLSEKLSELGQDNLEIIVSVATEFGQVMQGELKGVKVLCGKRSQEEKIELLKDAAACIDATHPYAVGITEHIKAACELAGTEYIRLLRAKSMDTDSLLTFESVAEAAEYLKGKEGNVLVTTGAKELISFKESSPERIYARVLPIASSLDAAEKAGVPRQNVIAMQGPFSESLNIALMKEFDIEYMVTKDGGKAGGFEEKIEAAEKCGVKTLLVRRPEDEGMSESEVFDYLKDRIL